RSTAGLIAANRYGNTTLIPLLAGPPKTTTASIVLDGIPLSALSRRELARRVAVVPQDTHVTFDFSAIEIVLMGRYAHLGAFALEGPDDFAIAQQALAATGTAGLEPRGVCTPRRGRREAARGHRQRAGAGIGHPPARRADHRTGCRLPVRDRDTPEAVEP